MCFGDLARVIAVWSLNMFITRALFLFTVKHRHQDRVLHLGSVQTGVFEPVFRKGEIRRTIDFSPLKIISKENKVKYNDGTFRRD